jgi:hypothetical protein
MGERRGANRVLVGERSLEKPDVDGRIILKCIFDRLNAEA